MLGRGLLDAWFSSDWQVVREQVDGSGILCSAWHYHPPPVGALISSSRRTQGCISDSSYISMQDPQRQDFVFLPSSAVILPAWTVHAQSRCLHESLSLLSEKWMSGWILCWQTVVIALSPVLVWIWKNHLNLLRKMSIFCHRHHW